MRLLQRPFDTILSGEKTIEIRLFDEKRQQITVGDYITFSKLPDEKEHLTVEVVRLWQYPTFQALVDAHSMGSFGYPEQYDKKAFVDSLYTLYTPEEEQRYGVLGIQITLI